MQRYECGKCGGADFWLYRAPGLAHGICRGCGYAVVIGGPEPKAEPSPAWGAYARQEDVEVEAKRSLDLQRDLGVGRRGPEVHSKVEAAIAARLNAKLAGIDKSGLPSLKPVEAIKQTQPGNWRPEWESKRVSGYRAWWNGKTEEQKREHMRAAWEAWRAKSHRTQGVSPHVHAGVARPQAGA